MNKNISYIMARLLSVLTQNIHSSYDDNPWTMEKIGYVLLLKTIELRLYQKIKDSCDLLKSDTIHEKEFPLLDTNNMLELLDLDSKSK